MHFALENDDFEDTLEGQPSARVRKWVFAKVRKALEPLAKTYHVDWYTFIPVLKAQLAMGIGHLQEAMLEPGDFFQQLETQVASDEAPIWASKEEAKLLEAVTNKWIIAKARIKLESLAWD
eukprot:6063027-Amphidinium_carterae.1